MVRLASAGGVPSVHAITEPGLSRRLADTIDCPSAPGRRETLDSRRPVSQGTPTRREIAWFVASGTRMLRPSACCLKLRARLKFTPSPPGKSTVRVSPENRHGRRGSGARWPHAKFVRTSGSTVGAIFRRAGTTPWPVARLTGSRQPNLSDLSDSGCHRHTGSWRLEFASVSLVT